MPWTYWCVSPKQPGGSLEFVNFCIFPYKVRKDSFMKETAAFSQSTCDLYFINSFFINKLKNTNKHYLHEQFVFWGFVCGMHIFICWLLVIKFLVFVCIPLLIYQRWNRYSVSQNRRSAVSNPWLNTFPSLKSINRHLIKWNIQAMPLSHTHTQCRQPPMEKTPITDGNTCRLQPWEIPPCFERWHRIQFRSWEWFLLKCSIKIRMNIERSPFECWLKWIWNCFSERYTTYSEAPQTVVVNI